MTRPAIETTEGIDSLWLDITAALRQRLEQWPELARPDNAGDLANEAIDAIDVFWRENFGEPFCPESE